MSNQPDLGWASENWRLSEDAAAKPSALVVQLRRRSFVLPYFRFVYAEGDNSQVKIAFSSHLVTVNGHGLGALLAALAAQRVLRIIQPTANEAKFDVRSPETTHCQGSRITDVSVEQFQ